MKNTIHEPSDSVNNAEVEISIYLISFTAYLHGKVQVNCDTIEVMTIDLIYCSEITFSQDN